MATTGPALLEAGAQPPQSNMIGIGAMLKILGGNQETVEAVGKSLGKTIRSVAVSGNSLDFVFTDGGTLSVWDDGQSCCENRYMSTEDELGYFVGGNLLKLELVDAPNIDGADGGTHEVQFLDVHTSKGMFQVANHNEHNGYYGGFGIVARAS